MDRRLRDSCNFAYIYAAVVTLKRILKFEKIMIISINVISQLDKRVYVPFGAYAKWCRRKFLKFFLLVLVHNALRFAEAIFKLFI